MRAIHLAGLLALLAAAPLVPAAPDVPCSGSDVLGDACADLVVDALDASNIQPTEESFGPAHCAVAEGLVDSGDRKLLRFPLATANVGRGPVVLGVPSQHPAWFTDSACHGHAHFDDFAAYRLWAPDAYPAWAHARAAEPERPASEVLAEHPELAAFQASGRKQGFCLLDGERITPLSPAPAFPTCGYQGISPGWKDRYDTWLDGQWVDVTGLPMGYYVLEWEANPERRIAESDFGNNAASQLVWVE